MILLPTVKSILNLFGFNSIEQFLYKIGTIDNKDFPSQKTLHNILHGKTASPSKKTIKKFFVNLSEDVGQQIGLQDILQGKKLLPHYNSEWEAVYEGIKLGFPDDFFPKFLDKLEKVIGAEKKLLEEFGALKTPKKRFFFLAKEKHMRQVLTKYEQSLLMQATGLSPELIITLGKAQVKRVLLFAAYIDAEHSLFGQHGKDEGFSVLKPLMPRVENSEYISPIELLFRRWRELSGASYEKMAQVIPTDTQQEDRKDAAKTKFRQWRKGEHQAPSSAIREILLAIIPDIHPVILDKSILLYYYAWFLHSMFQDNLLDINNVPDILQGQRPFKIDSELAEWMKEHYEMYFDMAYKEFAADQT